MIQLFHIKTPDVLLYHGTEHDLARICQHAPEAKRVNGEAVAVPRTLANLQLLRWLNYPVVPIMDGYDWPIEAGKKPLEHQQIMANFMVLHPRSLNLSDMGCVGGETLIDTDQGPLTIRLLAEQGQKIRVRSLTSSGPRFVEIAAPFAKGRERLYRVRFQSGRSIVVTKRHVFLTCRGWASCENVDVGAQLPVFDVYPQESIWAPYLAGSQSDVHRSLQTIEDCLQHFGNPSYDELPRRAEDSVLFGTPLLIGVRGRNRSLLHRDDLGSKCTHTDQSSGARLSKQDFGAQIDRGNMGAFLSGYATTQTDNQFHICAQYRLLSNQQPAAQLDRELQLCIPISEACEKPFDIVTHITYERTDIYYDMQVPTHANYVAHGLCHHNTMKTLSTLWAADFLMRQHEGLRALIVAPLSILERVWANAIFRNFLNRRTFAILHGTAEKRLEQLAREADFYIINHDGVGVGAHTRKRFELDGFSHALACRDDIQLAIVDEASAYKDGTTKRHRIAREVFGKKPYLWLLSGTPTPNAPTDAYGLAKLINNAFGKSFGTFQLETMIKVSQFRWVPQKDGYEKARRLLTPSIRFDIKDVWKDAPPFTTQQREVPLTPDQKKHMADLKRDLQVTVKSGDAISAVNEAAARMKFVQIALGGIYDANHKSHTIDAEPRYAELERIVEETNRKAVIFVPLTNIVQLVYARLAKRWQCAIINGDVTPKERARVIQQFAENGNLRVVICDPQATAHGINEFVAADTCIWFGTTDKTELYQQGVKRVHRPGQRHPVTVVQLVSNPLEREIYRRLETNTSLQGVLLDAVRKGEW